MLIPCTMSPDYNVTCAFCSFFLIFFLFILETKFNIHRTLLYNNHLSCYSNANYCLSHDNNLSTELINHPLITSLSVMYILLHAIAQNKTTINDDHKQ